MRFNSLRKVLALRRMPHSVSRRSTKNRQVNGSASIHAFNRTRCSSLNLLGAPLRGWSGRLAKPALNHLRRRSRIVSGNTLCFSATSNVVCPSASNKIAWARSRSRQSLPFLTMIWSNSRSVSVSSTRTTRISFIGWLHKALHSKHQTIFC